MDEKTINQQSYYVRNAINQLKQKYDIIEPDKDKKARQLLEGLGYTLTLKE